MKVSKKRRFTIKKTYGKHKLPGFRTTKTVVAQIKKSAPKSILNIKKAFGKPKIIPDKPSSELVLETISEPLVTVSNIEKPDYDNMSYKELKAEAEKYGIKTWRVKKIDLIEDLKSL